MKDKYFLQVIENIKNFLGIKRDFELAEKLGMKESNFAHHKRRGSIPYEEIIRFCKKERVPLDKVFSDDIIPSMVSESAVPYGHARFNDLCKRLEKVLSEGTVDEKAKVLGIIEAVYNEIHQRKETKAAAMHEEDDARYKRSA